MMEIRWWLHLSVSLRLSLSHYRLHTLNFILILSHIHILNHAINLSHSHTRAHFFFCVNEWIKKLLSSYVQYLSALLLINPFVSKPSCFPHPCAKKIPKCPCIPNMSSKASHLQRRERCQPRERIRVPSIIMSPSWSKSHPPPHALLSHTSVTWHTRDPCLSRSSAVSHESESFWLYLLSGWLQLNCGFCVYLLSSSSRMLFNNCT